MGPSYSSLYTCIAILACSGSFSAGRAANLRALPEYLRPDPFGQIVSTDRIPGAALENRITIETPRAAYASCQLTVDLPESGDYRLEIKPAAPRSGVQAELFREWFHFVPAAKQYYPDALVPVESPFTGSVPDPDNRIPKQTSQAFWIDFWIPSSVAPGDYTITAVLHSARHTSSLPIHIKVLKAVVPADDAVTMDHNSYGTSWFAPQYPKLCNRIGKNFFDSPEYFALIHAYHRMFYEHRGSFHQLGYGHAGKVGPDFAPELEGSGRNEHIANWNRYDLQYGPLLDGSAFTRTRRGPKPIPFVYLPINPEWPASFELWGEPGYQAEFVNVVSEMEHHFRQKGWTHTNFEMFFNQKKRYRGFNWDGDETRFPKDYSYFREYSRLLKLAVPADSPVRFVFRADVSWTMEKQWRELAGVVNFWVCGGGMFSWFPYAPQLLKGRGDIVWTYGGTPAVTDPSSRITLDVLRAWMQGVQGFVRWETTSPGPDPWFHFAGGTENLVYPGDRFGIVGPIASIRLKLERNAVQDIDLLEACARRGQANTVKAAAAQAFNKTVPDDWWTPRPALADTKPENWSNADIEDATRASPKFDKLLDAAAWQRLRRYIYQVAEEGK